MKRWVCFLCVFFFEKVVVVGLVLVGSFGIYVVGWDFFCFIWSLLSLFSNIACMLIFFFFVCYACISCVLGVDCLLC